MPVGMVEKVLVSVEIVAMNKCIKRWLHVSGAVDKENDTQRNMQRKGARGKFEWEAKPDKKSQVDILSGINHPWSHQR